MKLNHDTGYGLIKRNVMRNPNVSLQGKAIYSYLVSFAGNDMSAYPSQELMCEELGVSINTLRKYIKELKDQGLIEVKQGKSRNGSFMHNLYILTDKVTGTQNLTTDTQNLVGDVQQNLVDDVAQNLVDVGTQNLTPNNNSINNNSINNNIENKDPGEEKSNSEFESDLPKPKKLDPLEMKIYTFTKNTELQQALRDFVESRKQMKAAFTERAFDMMLKKLRKLGHTETEQLEIVTTSVINGWKGIFELDRRKPKNENEEFYQKLQNWAANGERYDY